MMKRDVDGDALSAFAFMRGVAIPQTSVAVHDCPGERELVLGLTLG
jgi:hypothetical protein